MSRIRRVMLVQPRSPGGNFEYVAIPRQGLLFLSGALQQSKGRYLYEREIHFEDRSGKLDIEKERERLIYAIHFITLRRPSAH